MFAAEQKTSLLTFRQYRLLHSLTGKKVYFHSKEELNLFVQQALDRLPKDQPGSCLARCLLEDFL